MAKKFNTALSGDVASRKKRHAVLEKMAQILENLELPEIKPKINKTITSEKLIHNLFITVRPGNSQLARLVDMMKIVKETISQSVVPYEIHKQTGNLYVKINPGDLLSVNVDKFLAQVIPEKIFLEAQTENGNDKPKVKEKNSSSFPKNVEDEITDKYVFINPDPEAGLENYKTINVDEIYRIPQHPIRPADISISGSNETKFLPEVDFSNEKKQEESQKKETGGYFKKLRNAIALTLKNLGFNSSSDYISISPIAIGATINCKTESLEQMKSKLMSLYPDKIFAKEGKKTIQVLSSFLESYLENSTKNKKITNTQTIDFSNTKNKNDQVGKSLAEKLISGDEMLFLKNGKLKKQSKIQTTQKIETMTKKEEKELRGHIKSLIKSLGLNLKAYYQITQTNDNHLDVYLRDPKDAKKFEEIKNVVVEGRHIYFPSHFTFGGGKKSNTPVVEKSPAKVKSVKEDGRLEELFDQIRAIISGPNLPQLVEKFEKLFPDQTLWLSNGESSKKIKIQVLLEKLFK